MTEGSFCYENRLLKGTLGAAQIRQGSESPAPAWMMRCGVGRGRKSQAERYSLAFLCKVGAYIAPAVLVCLCFLGALRRGGERTLGAAQTRQGSDSPAPRVDVAVRSGEREEKPS